MAGRELLQSLCQGSGSAPWCLPVSIQALRTRLVDLLGGIFQVEWQEAGHYRFQFSVQQLYFLLALFQFAVTLFALWQGYRGIVVIGLLGTAVFIGSMVFNQRARHRTALWLAFGGINLFSAIYTLALGWGSGFYFHLLIIGPLLFLHPGGQLRLKSVLTLFAALHMALLNQLIVNATQWAMLSNEGVTLLHYGNAIATYAFLAYFTFAYHWAAKQSEAQLLEQSDKWQHLASRDMLTGLYNRRAMSELLDEEVSRVNRGMESFSLALVDIDHFKAINDRYGHQSGDAVIRGVAQRMAGFFRQHDLVARWGGEEFLILFPETRAEQAAIALDKLRLQISAQPIQCEGQAINTAVTIGLTQYDPQRGLSQAIQAADEALYQGKQQGRNRVIVQHD